MNYQIEKTDSNLTSIKENLKLIIKEIKNSKDLSFINETIDKVKLAREWAKIQNKVEEMYSDLLKIEIECFIQIVKLGCINELDKSKRNTAKFFSELKETEIESLIKNNEGLSAIAIYRKYNWSEKNAEHMNRGIDYAKNNIKENENFYSVEESERTNFIKEVSQRRNTAIAVLLDDYSTQNKSFTIDQFADDLILETGLDNFGTDVLNGFKEGVREVCRDAVKSAKTLFIKEKKVPRFITCLNGFDKYLRIPFENATLEQFQETIDMRKEQLEQDKKALENLIDIYNMLSDSYNELLNLKKIKKNSKTLIKNIIENI